ncbi:MAG TPA: adenylate/guanylate cyclase domain-containing protein [bacterium]
MSTPQTREEEWRAYLTGRHPTMLRERRIFRIFPHDPRCKLCNAPFAGIGSVLMRAIGKARSSKNPNYCNMCEVRARKERGGAEIELTMLFADVRGSTTLAEQMSARDFSQLLNRFYDVANRILIDSDALVDKLVGDEVIGLYLPYLPHHAANAVQAARDLLAATGHTNPDGPWLPVGAGIHTGVAYVGIVGSEDTVVDFTALGDAVNITARLASLAGPGEVLVSDAATAAASFDRGTLEHRELQLKGRTEPIGVSVVTARASADLPA